MRTIHEKAEMAFKQQDSQRIGGRARSLSLLFPTGLMEPPIAGREARNSFCPSPNTFTVKNCSWVK